MFLNFRMTASHPCIREHITFREIHIVLAKAMSEKIIEILPAFHKPNFNHSSQNQLTQELNRFSTLLHSHFINRVLDLLAFFKSVKHLRKFSRAWTQPAFFQHTFLFLYYVLLFFPAASMGEKAGKKVSMIKRKVRKKCTENSLRFFFSTFLSPVDNSKVSRSHSIDFVFLRQFFTSHSLIQFRFQGNVFLMELYHHFSRQVQAF